MHGAKSRTRSMNACDSGCSAPRQDNGRSEYPHAHVAAPHPQSGWHALRVAQNEAIFLETHGSMTQNGGERQ